MKQNNVVFNVAFLFGLKLESIFALYSGDKCDEENVQSGDSNLVHLSYREDGMSAWEFEIDRIP